MSDNLHVACPKCHTVNRVPPEKLGAGGTCGRCKAPLFSGHPVEINRFNFQQHIQNSDVPIIVDFWAPWCGPCLSFAPVFERVASELEPRVRFGKIDSEAEQGLAANFGIRSIPTLVALRRGEEVARQSGAMDQASFKRWVESVL